METEVHNFVFVWISVVAALIYCRYISDLVPVGPKRLLLFLPVILLFLLLPLRLTTISLGGLTAFFVAWLCNFKLLLLACGKGPLAPPSPPLSLPLFVAVASLPIKISPSAGAAASKNGGGGDGLKSPANYVAKCLLVASLFPLYQQSDYVHEKVMMVAYSIHMYIGLEVALAAVGTVAGRLIGAAVEPQFDEPYLATSLQDFWGRRWNLMVTSILRPSVYDPVWSASGHLVGRRWATLPAVLATFAVSALMHELIFYYIGRKEPAWVVTWFFLLHGVAVAAEVAAKKALRSTRWRLPAEASRPLTVGFVVVTGFWLFLPPLLRCDAVGKGRRETIAVIEFGKGVWSMLRFNSFNVVSGP
ncbi:acyl-CoA--sterol O-acyltransferase 1-like [Rhodamnia argentea]|uniref:Acyl-CoA--sterol O-acyltransferase 1-like n=1 Tax=Rhodamnia argentea TaxID=178133 RepID=A0A8B8R0L2_9MYRT|nr:acyl-CoA--sterol O-acyltransferase 1-like [Rhodamnia argentea]